MSKFYSKYLEKYDWNKPNWLKQEEAINEAHKQHVYQARITTTGKHTGSKSQRKLAYNMAEVTRRVDKYDFLSRLFASFKKKNK